MTDVASDAARGALVDVGEVELWVDLRGPDDGEAVLLIAGSDTPGFRWTPAMVDPIADAGYRVVRFDNRDSGRSTRFGADAVYRLEDLAADAVGLLERLGIGAAHLIGSSMGGMVAQVMALDHPSRVGSLTLIATSAAPGDERLPGPDEAFVEAMAQRLFAGPPADTEGRVDWLVEFESLVAGSLYPFDRAREEALAEVHLATGWVAESGHGLAVAGSPGRLDRLGDIAVPTLVVHGTADPVFPIEHGRALAVGVDGAVLIEVDGLGHEVRDELFADLMPVLLHHLRESSRFTAG